MLEICFYYDNILVEGMCMLNFVIEVINSDKCCKYEVGCDEDEV